MLLGPIHLRSPKLNCWEACYEFLDFDDKKGMFEKVHLPPGEWVNCACVHRITDVKEVTCKDVEYNKDGSIGAIKMRALHLGNDCIYKRSIIPKIKDEVNNQGASVHNPSPMLKKMIYEMAKKEKKRCAMCDELNVGYTSKFDKCRDCRRKLKLLEEQAKREAKEKEDKIKNVRRKYSEKVSDSWKARNGKYKGQYWSNIMIKDPDYVKWYQQDFKYGFGALTVEDLLRYDTKNYWSRRDEDELDTKIWYNIMFHMFVQDMENKPDSEEYQIVNKLILEKL